MSEDVQGLDNSQNIWVLVATGLLVCLWYGIVAVLYLPTSFKGSGLVGELTMLLAGVFAVAASALLVSHWIQFPGMSFSSVGQFCVLLTLLLATFRLVAWGLSSLWRREFSQSRDCIIVGSGPRAMAMYRFLHNSPLVTYRVLGFVDERGTHSVQEEIRHSIIGGLSDLRTILRNHVVDEVFLALPVKSCYSDLQMAIHICEEAGIESKLPSDLFSCTVAKVRTEHQGSRPMLAMKVVRHDYTLFIKKAIDMGVGVLGVFVLGLPMALIAISIRLTSPGPAIFTQNRYGRNKRIFKMYKFRTMAVNAEEMQPELEHLNEMGGPVFKIRNDPRVTPLGRFLRRTSLDELPQFLNVLRGEMSLVGPRPLPLRDVSRFGEPGLMRRFSVKPGLTCLWQIHGRSETTFEHWMELDLRYIDNWSLLLDLEILLKTLPVVLRGQGAL